MSLRGKQIYKKMTDIQKLEQDKKQKKREETCNMWINQNSNRKIVREDYPDRARDHLKLLTKHIAVKC
jgi:hypothetical protein